MENWKAFVSEQASEDDIKRARDEEEKVNLDQFMQELCKYDYLIYMALDHPKFSVNMLERALSNAGASGDLLELLIKFIEDKTGFTLEELASTSLGKYARSFAKGFLKGACEDYKNQS